MKKKHAAKLALNKETIVALRDPENALRKVAGGNTVVPKSGHIWCVPQT